MESATAEQTRATVREAYRSSRNWKTARRMLRRRDELLRARRIIIDATGLHGGGSRRCSRRCRPWPGLREPAGDCAAQGGERVLDLGSGGGFDAFLAARQVGPTGRVIGVDMTSRDDRPFRRNAAKVGLSYVDSGSATSNSCRSTTHRSTSSCRTASSISRPTSRQCFVRRFACGARRPAGDLRHGAIGDLPAAIAEDPRLIPAASPALRSSANWSA